ncbi:MAG: amino acid adenylation domain-containing protein [Thainema sp.]
MQQLDRVITGFRLSPQQERLWSLQRQNSIYRVQGVLRLEGELDRLRLKAGLQKLVNQHEILRTTFHRRPGMKWPLQVVSSDSVGRWVELDWSHTTFTKQQKQLIELLHQIGNQTDLESQAPLQVYLIQSAPAQFWLLISLPALCADTATLSILIDALLANYADAEYETESIQYVQISEWQHELLATQDEDYQAGQAYWNRVELKQKQVVSLPFEHRVSDQFQPAIFQIDLPEEQQQLIENFCQLSQSVGVEKRHILLTCWQALLGRLVDNQNFLISAAFDGRSYEELSSALGLLTTYLPFYAIDTHLSFDQALQQVKDQSEMATQWQEYFTWQNWSAETLINYLPVSFNYTDWLLPCTVQNLTVSLDHIFSCIERFHLNLSCHCISGRLLLQFQYDPQVLDASVIERLADQFRVLLSNALANPNCPIRELEILSAAERHRVLAEFNPVPSEQTVEDCLHQHFEVQAAQFPDALAVVCEDQHLSYAQLNQQANQLAHCLQQQDITTDIPVALYLERSCNLMVGLLGILKAGGAYLPLDPALPSAGIMQRLNDAQAPVIVTQSSLLNTLPETTAQVVCLDRDWSAISHYSTENPHSSVKPDNLAYLIYTSGSTGVPKGVAVEHRHVLNYLDGIQQRLNLSPGASYASVSTIAADLGNTAIFSALCTGGCLHLISAERASNPDALAAYNQQYQIDCLKIVPSHLQVLITSAAHPADILPKQCLILGGEAASWELIRNIRELSNCRILNHYGPTEATVGVLTYEIDEIAHEGIVPLGQPLAHSQVYILDQQQQLVPIEVPGELYIGGATVARGYWQRPDLTTERFILNLFANPSTHPFNSSTTHPPIHSSTHPLPHASRLYKTGDRAIYRADGTIEFRGRVDDQVKLRGYRIELGEVESVLQQHPAVQRAVVVLREDQPGQKRLVAYVVVNNCTQDTQALQDYLAQRFPDYMVPSAIAVLDALPLTPNGKVDRHALPVPEMIQSQVSYTPPTTQSEQILTQIWADVLGLEQVGIHDNFFSLGGDSILSIQVIAKANQAGLHLTPKQLFEHQTIVGLAAVAGTESQVQAEQGEVTGSVPLTPIQRWFFEQEFAQPHHWNQAVLLECRQMLDAGFLKQTIEHLIEHHDQLRSHFVHTKSGWQQDILPTSRVRPILEVIDLADCPRAEQAAVLESHANCLQESLDLGSGDLVRVALFDLGADQPQRLLIIVHHLVIDGVSWRILLEDFQTVYGQFSQGQRVQLPAKTTSFQEWANQLQQYAQSLDGQAEVERWQFLLTQATPQIPVDREGQPNTVASTQTVLVELSPSETQTLLQDVPTAYNTHINDVLLTALAQSFQRWIGRSSILIDLEGHGREDLFPGVNLSRTVGWFTVVYPVCLTVDSAESGLARPQVKEQLRQILNSGIGYGLLRYGSNQSAIAQLQSLPRPQVKFNYLGQFDPGMNATAEFVTAAESYGATRSPFGHRSHILEIIGYVTEGSLRLEWLYSQNLHDAATIEALAQHFLVALRSLIQSSQEPATKHFTPSDFAEFQWSNWNQDDLNDIMAAIGDD